MPSYKNLAALRFCFLCSAFRFLNPLAFCRTYFLRAQVYRYQKPAFDLSAFFLISTTDFEKQCPTFPSQTLLFSQAYVPRAQT
jgi:hypothetical protein